MRKSKKNIVLFLVILLAVSLVPQKVEAKHFDFLNDIKFPVDNIKSHFYDDWKEKRGGGSRLHLGLDVRAPKGAKIIAVADGKVNTVAFTESSGYYIAIDHMNGWMSLYVHLNDDIVGNDNAGDKSVAFAKDFKKGDVVKKGEVIGFVGNSGNAEGTVPHLHFELKYLGVSQDIYNYIVKAWDNYEKLKLFPRNTISLLIN